MTRTRSQLKLMAATESAQICMFLKSKPSEKASEIVVIRMLILSEYLSSVISLSGSAV